MTSPSVDNSSGSVTTSQRDSTSSAEKSTKVQVGNTNTEHGISTPSIDDKCSTITRSAVTDHGSKLSKTETNEAKTNSTQVLPLQLKTVLVLPPDLIRSLQ